jgi:hypothetical protein
MKIKIKETTYQDKEVNVEFPYYRQHDVSGDNYESIYYTKIIDEKTKISLNCSSRHGEKSWEMEIDRSNVFSDSNNSNYILGRGEYKLSEEEFNAKVKEFKEFVNKYL